MRWGGDLRMGMGSFGGGGKYGASHLTNGDFVVWVYTAVKGWLDMNAV